MVAEVSSDQSGQPEMPPKARRWNDPAYKKFVEVCAKDLGISINVLYESAGIDPSSHSKNAAKNGRSIEQILAIAHAAGKDPALFIAAGTMRQAIEYEDTDLAKLALVSNIAAHLFASLSRPERLIHPHAQELLDAILSVMRKPN